MTNERNQGNVREVQELTAADVGELREDAVPVEIPEILLNPPEFTVEVNGTAYHSFDEAVDAVRAARSAYKAPLVEAQRSIGGPKVTDPGPSGTDEREIDDDDQGARPGETRADQLRRRVNRKIEAGEGGRNNGKETGEGDQGDSGGLPRLTP